MQNKGILILERTGHANAWVTWPNMYEYLPTNHEKQLETESYSSTMFYMNTRTNYEQFMRWHILCSLVQQCIAPTNKLYCNFKLKPQVTCHRYDMSSLNILLSNYHDFNVSRYAKEDRVNVNVKRGDGKIQNIQDWTNIVKG